MLCSQYLLLPLQFERHGKDLRRIIWIDGGQVERPIATLQHSVTGRPVGRQIAVGETRRIVTHPAVAALDDDLSKPSHLSYQRRVDVIATDGAVFLEGDLFSRKLTVIDSCWIQPVDPIAAGARGAGGQRTGLGCSRIERLEPEIECVRHDFYVSGGDK